MVSVTLRLTEEKHRLFDINCAAEGISMQSVLEKAVDVFNQMHSEEWHRNKNWDKYLDEVPEPRK